MSNNITFVIFTYNEVSRIENVIKNFKDYGNILLADDNSNDGTLDIARSYDCDILLRTKKYDFIENQHLLDLIYEKITTDWIYWAYADEIVDKTTLEQIISIISDDNHDVINIDRKNYYYGKFCYDLYHSRMNRVFKKNAISFEGNRIHGFGKPTVSAERIFVLKDKYFVHHFISYTSSAYLNVINRYTDCESPFKRQLSPVVLFFYLLYKAVFIHYIKERGYKLGFTGVAFIEIMMFYTMTRNFKLYEKENGLDRNSIEDMNNLFRNRLLNK